MPQFPHAARWLLLRDHVIVLVSSSCSVDSPRYEPRASQLADNVESKKAKLVTAKYLRVTTISKSEAPQSTEVDPQWLLNQV